MTRHDGEADDSTDVLRAAVSDVEVLRHRDIAELDSVDRARLAELFGTPGPAAAPTGGVPERTVASR